MAGKNEVAVTADNDEKKWRAEDDLRTMTKAEEIRKDKERHKLMKQMAKDKIKAMSGICQ